jgi:hypothetical protein
VWVSWLSLKTKVDKFSSLGLKTDTVTVFWFEPQNQADDGLLVAPQNRREEIDAGHTSRSSGLLRLKASQTRVSQSGIKIGGGATMVGARDIITKVTSR